MQFYSSVTGPPWDGLPAHTTSVFPKSCPPDSVVPLLPLIRADWSKRAQLSWASQILSTRNWVLWTMQKLGDLGLEWPLVRTVSMTGPPPWTSQKWKHGAGLGPDIPGFEFWLLGLIATLCYWMCDVTSLTSFCSYRQWKFGKEGKVAISNNCHKAVLAGCEISV